MDPVGPFRLDQRVHNNVAYKAAKGFDGATLTEVTDLARTQNAGQLTHGYNSAMTNATARSCEFVCYKWCIPTSFLHYQSPHVSPAKSSSHLTAQSL